MQATWQKHIDASISSTVNLPNSATIDDVKDLYMYAWKQGLKGITVFRDGCKRLGILTTDNTSNDTPNDIATNDDDEPSITSLPRGVIEEVSDDLISAKRTIVNGCGRMYLHLDFDENTGQPLETFLECGSGGGCERNLTFISRLMSLALRGGVPIESIIDQAFSVKPCKAYCDRRKKLNDTSKGNSCPQAIGYALVELNKKIQDRCFADDEEESIKEIKNTESTIQYKCPECGKELIFEGGCVICHNCGWSRCE
jgi:ribonucleoside-diphosphate reductase alpha chain